jgi:hypothetical protein
LVSVRTPIGASIGASITTVATAIATSTTAAPAPAKTSAISILGIATLLGHRRCRHRGKDLTLTVGFDKSLF